jgi:hypothetical protein
MTLARKNVRTAFAVRVAVSPLLLGKLRGALFGTHVVPFGNAVCRAEPNSYVVMLSSSRVFVERFAREYASVHRDRGFFGASSTAGLCGTRLPAAG